MRYFTWKIELVQNNLWKIVGIAVSDIQNLDVGKIHRWIERYIFKRDMSSFHTALLFSRLIVIWTMSMMISLVLSSNGRLQLLNVTSTLVASLFVLCMVALYVTKLSIFILDSLFKILMNCILITTLSKFNFLSGVMYYEVYQLADF